MFENSAVSSSFRNSIETALKASRFPHAVIFEGSDEKTRLDAAKETAKALLCKGAVKPCNNCSACLKTESGSHPDLHILGKGDGKIIKVDAVRDIKAKALIYPNDSDKSIFIIEGAEFMNLQAQNALLKIFEEPAKHVSFILTCSSKSALLETIISRAVCYTLGEEKSNTEESEELLLARETARELLRIYVKENEFAFLKKTAIFLKDKAFFLSVLEEMIPVVRDAVILQNGGKDTVSHGKDEALLLKDGITRKKGLEVMEALQNLIDDIKKNANHNLSITRFSSVLYGIKSN